MFSNFLASNFSEHLNLKIQLVFLIFFHPFLPTFCMIKDNLKHFNRILFFKATFETASKLENRHILSQKWIINRKALSSNSFQCLIMQSACICLVYGHLADIWSILLLLNLKSHLRAVSGHISAKWPKIKDNFWSLRMASAFNIFQRKTLRTQQLALFCN